MDATKVGVRGGVERGEASCLPSLRGSRMLKRNVLGLALTALQVSSIRFSRYSPEIAPEFHRSGCSHRSMAYLNVIGAQHPRGNSCMLARQADIHRNKEEVLHNDHDIRLRNYDGMGLYVTVP
jgi:hypothetical protein